MTRLPAIVLLSVLSAATILAPSPQPALGQAAAADTLPTFDEIRALYDKGEYKDTLKQLARLLSLKGKAAEGMDRYALLMLRAESHLRLKATSGATQALTEAAKVAPDEESAAKARALNLLIKRSKNLQFTPKVATGKGAAGGPFDITDEERREAAFNALYVGERAALKPKIAKADKAKNLPAIADAIKAALALRDLELAATGKTDDTADTVDALVQRAHKLMAAGLDDAMKRIESIADRANELVQYTARVNGGTETRTRRRGLQASQTKELRGIVETCRKVFESCKELSAGFAEDDDEQFDDLQEQAEDTGQRAQDVLTDDYTDRS